MTTVLNTRPREQAAELSEALRADGLIPVEAPAIAIEPAWESDRLTATRDALRAGAYAWVILASANAGRALLDDLGQTPVLCGASTAHALGIQPRVTLPRFNASTALAAIAPRLQPGDRVLLPRAAAGRDELPDGLVALGVDLEAPVAYRTVGCDEAARRLATDGIEVVTVCSPSAVAALAPAVSRLRRLPIVALGDTTASALRARGLTPAAIAERSSMDDLVAAVRRVVDGVPA